MGGWRVLPFHFEKGLRSFAGWWYFSTTGTHVGFESWLERDHLMPMDFDPDIGAVASQPFWLRWDDERGVGRRHAPDFFARREDGTGVVIDVRPDDRIPGRDAEVFAVTAAACALAGWEFRRVGEIDPVLTANVRWLSRYRHPRCLVPRVAAALVGERLRVLPVLFHQLWCGQLACRCAIAFFSHDSTSWSSSPRGHGVASLRSLPGPADVR
ncbi:MAG: TnsA-like heteromeric transposase endonuclease subunit [Pseudonocardia sp.]